jgi:hypothetical protein
MGEFGQVSIECEIAAKAFLCPRSRKTPGVFKLTFRSQYSAWQVYLSQNPPSETPGVSHRLQDFTPEIELARFHYAENMNLARAVYPEGQCHLDVRGAGRAGDERH